MHNNWGYKRKIAVGLMITFALLFSCVDAIYQQRTALIETGKEQIAEEENQEEIPEEDVSVIDPNQPMIALTFDDGPGPGTVRLLEALQANKAKATFFMLGSRVEKYQEAVQRMVEAGCELGNHTTNHVKLTKYDATSIASEINYTRDVIANIVGQGPTLVRPPYGAVNEVVQSVAETPLVLWSVDTNDWKLKDTVLVRDYVLNNIKDGDIILMHDIYETTVNAAIELIPLLQERGYQLVTVSELAQARGISMENGGKYYSFHKQNGE